jgi:predicted ATPase
VVVGDLIGEAEAMERSVVGETPNLAARLQAAAPPGAVVIGQGTQRLLGTLFELAELAPLELKGIEGKQRVWLVRGEGRAEGRFEAMHGEGMTKLVGRDLELGLLAERWQRAKGGEGQVAILSGEPGIGKSRIVMALRESLRAESRTSLRYFCSPQHTGTAFWPVISQLERAAGFAADDSPARRLDKLEALLRQADPGIGEIAPLCADLLSLPNDGRYAPLELTPEEKKARTMRGLLDQLGALARRQPVLVILEDAHWLDPTTREFFHQIIDRVQGLPALCVVTCRPEFQLDWTRHAHVTLLTLNRLGRAQSAQIVAELTQRQALPPALLESILAKTDGVPLFVEELTKMVLESGLARPAGDGLAASNATNILAVPDTLRDSLMARLDRLATAREVAQIGAVLGREFEHELLAAVADLDAATLARALDQLVAAELVFRRGVAPRLTYSFKHALVQDTAYQSLLKSRRQHLHARAAEALRTRFAARVAAAPELLAHHLTEAGLAAEAAAAWLAAGDHGLMRSAYLEAIGHLRRGRAVAATVPPSPERDRVETRLNNALGQAFHTTHGPSGEVEESYRRARELSEATGDQREWVRASYGLWFCHNWRMEHLAARRSAAELMERVEASEDSALVLQAHHASWTTAWQIGELKAALAHAELGRSIYDPARHHAFTALYGSHDAGVCSCNTQGITRTMLGFVDHGATDAAAGEALARQVGHPFSRALSLFFRSQIHLLRGETENTILLAREMSDLCAQQSIGVYGLVGMVVLGWCQAAPGAEPKEGMRLMRFGLDELTRVGARARRTEYLGLFADRALAFGDLAGCRAALAEAHALAEATGERFFVAELHRIEAASILAADSGASIAAERALARALDVARAQSAKLFELRAAVDLASLYAGRGERRRGHELLAPVHDWFTEGSATPLLRKARELRDALA